jgi:hypothetical protein
MTTLMLAPPASGLYNSILVNGRTYTSIPGVAIAVPDFDASDLQANGWLSADASVSGGPYLVAALPPASMALQGASTFVTDATAPSFLGTLTGGGAVVCPVFCNGVAWVPV